MPIKIEPGVYVGLDYDDDPKLVIKATEKTVTVQWNPYSKDRRVSKSKVVAVGANPAIVRRKMKERK